MAKRSSSVLLAALRRSRLLPLVTLAALLLPMFPRIARADGAPAPAGQAGVYPASVGLPETGASVANGASTVSVDPATGTAHAAIPFALPKARGRSQPTLGLSYSSASGIGVGGWGWSMTVPSIERTPLAGPPTYADPAAGGTVDPTVEDRFSFEGQALVPICTIPSLNCIPSRSSNAPYSVIFTTGTYQEWFPSPVTTGWTYFRLETGGSDARFFWSPDHNTWLVQYKSGETLELGMPVGGTTASAAIDWDHDQPTKAFRWNIVRQYDSERSGTVPSNLIVYSWAAQTGDSLDPRLYLTDVYDTLSVSSVSTGASAALASAAHHVRLYYENESQPAPVPTFVPPIWRTTPRFVLSHVDVTAAWDPPPTGPNSPPSTAIQRRLLRRYWFNYTPFQPDFTYSNRVELISVQVEGRCATPGTDFESSAGALAPATNCPMLPATSYGYLPAFPTFSPTPLAGQLNAVRPSDSTYVLDMNSDGIPDVVTMNPAVGNLTYLVSAIDADSIGASRPLTLTYPVGQGPASAPAPSTQWTSWTDDEHGVDLFPGYQVPPSPAFPGNWAGNGSISELIPQGGANGTSYSFSVMSPSTGGLGAASLSGTVTASINFWQASALSTCCSSKTAPLGYSMYAENVYGITDVDGDGLQDAITDTPVRAVASDTTGEPGNPPPPSLSHNDNWMPYVHFLSLRTTMQAPDGSIAAFSRAAPNNVSKVVPPYPWNSSQLYDANNQVALVPALPPAGQYVAQVSTISSVDPTVRILGDSGWYIDVVSDPQDTQYVSSFLEDMNGDGLVDWVAINTSPPGTYTTPDGTVTLGAGLSYWIGHGDGTFGSCQSGANDCTGSARFEGKGAPTWMQPVPFLPTGGTFAVHDVTGDGFPDLVIMTPTEMMLYINEHGTSFDKGNIVLSSSNTGNPSGSTTSSAVPAWNGKGQVFFGDMNGSGVDDIVVIQGTAVYYVDTQSGLRPGLLTGITDGYGGTTSIAYETTHDLQLGAAMATGAQWKYTSPQILHHVTKVTSSNGFTGASTPFAETRTVEYSYAQPIYDGRDRQFVGFQTVTRTEDGDASEPSRVTRTTFLAGICEIDQSTPGACPAPSADRPYRVLRGLPVLTDVYGPNGYHLSATHTEYDVHETMVGEDGRGVRFAYPKQANTYLYDSSTYIAVRAPLSQVDVSFDEGIAQVSNAYAIDSSSISADQLLVRTQTRDPYGNVVDTNDLGRPGVDYPIHQTATWALPSSDPTLWQWRPQTQHRDAFPATPGVPLDLPSDVSYVFYPDGQVHSASTTLAGAGTLVRASFGAPTPTSAAANGTALQFQLNYDPYGNLVLASGPGGSRCSENEFDTTFSQLPTTHLDYRDGCYTAAVATSQSWDRGLEQVTMSVAANGAISQYGYDGLGRLTSMTQPNVTTGGTGDPATVILTYNNVTAPSGDYFPVRQVARLVQDGTAQRQSFQYFDAWGQPLVTVSQADPSAGDAAPWIVSGIVQHTARGTVARAYQPTFWTGNAAAFPLSSPLQGASVSATYDAYNRVLTETGLDVQTAFAATYRALERDMLDADQLPSGSHAGASSRALLDGHGRVIAGVRNVHTAAGAMDAITVATAYNAAGQPLQITQSDSATGATIARTFQYDSRGHVVSNVEPNTSSNGVGWRYVYDASGDLVGTSDARGCGENLVYDGLGRVRWEDYSPCTSAQPTYTAAPSAWSATVSPASATGAETFFEYDAAGAAALNGELTDVYDRGAHTSFTYDARGRVVGNARQLATPTWTASSPIATSTNYSSWTFAKTFGYDGLNRPVSESSGADVAALLGVDMLGGGTNAGESLVTATYSARGVMASVQGSFGTVVASNVVDADGAPLTAVFGDAAGTTVANCYDGKRQLSQLSISRNAALPSCAHAAIGAPSAPAKTAQTVLVNDTFTRDAVGNPLTIGDGRVAAEWETGSMPVARAFTYDDSYRVTQASYAYATGTLGDSFVSPIAAVSADSPMSLASVTPRVRQQNMAYDWLGNTTSTTDDQSVFFDRSLGAIANGTPTAGPNQLQNAGHIAILGKTESGGILAATYDAAGNTTSLEVLQTRACSPGACPSQFVYEWDEIGQLVNAARWDTGATSATVSVSYVYDAFGHRVLRASLQGSDQPSYTAEVFPSLRLEGATWNVTAGVYERDGSTEVAYLTLGGASYGRVFATAVPTVIAPPPIQHLTATLPQPFAQHVFLEFGDSLGSTSAVVDKATGELVERTTYYAYGGVESDYRASNWSSFWEDYKFTGKESDLEVGLTYFGARYYSPALGRWLSPDPLAIHAAGADLNPYAYVRGRVTSAVDPNGLVDDPPPPPPPPPPCDGCLTWGAPGPYTPGPTQTGPPSWATEGGQDVPVPDPSTGPGPIDSWLDLGSGGGDAAQAEAFFSSFGFGDAIQAAVASIWNPLIEGITSGLNASLNANNTPLDLNNDDLKIDIAQNGPGQVGYAAGIVAPFLFGGGEARLGAEALIEAAEGATYAEGSFSVIDWTGYPEGMPRPDGALRVLSGDEYAAARALANETNAGIRAANGLEGSGLQIHEIQPVKFGGSPTDMANKMLLPTAEHIGPDGVHPQFWQPLLQWVTGGGG